MDKPISHADTQTTGDSGKSQGSTGDDEESSILTITDDEPPNGPPEKPPDKSPDKNQDEPSENPPPDGSSFDPNDESSNTVRFYFTKKNYLNNFKLL